MFKRFGWVFFVMAAVGTMAWMVFPRDQPKANAPGAVSNRETPVDRPAALNPGGPEEESDPEVARRSSRHSAGELEKYQVEKRLIHLKQAVRDQEEKVEEKRKALAAIVRTKGIIYKGPDADYSAGAVEKQEKTNSPDQTEEAIRRGLDAQDYVDAKQEFETNQILLEEMKLILANERVKPRDDGK